MCSGQFHECRPEPRIISLSPSAFPYLAVFLSHPNPYRQEFKSPYKKIHAMAVVIWLVCWGRGATLECLGMESFPRSFGLPPNALAPNERLRGGRRCLEGCWGGRAQLRDRWRRPCLLLHLSDSAPALPGGAFRSRIGKGALVARPAGAAPWSRREGEGAIRRGASCVDVPGAGARGSGSGDPRCPQVPRRGRERGPAPDRAHTPASSRLRGCYALL